MTPPLVLKLGGELVETADARARIAGFVAAEASRRPVVVVHGGGRAIDAELDRRGIRPKKVDGLRITDAATLEAVIAVLAGSANTELVAALVGARVAAVGLTGVDAGFGRASRAQAHVTSTGAAVDLGFVGDPTDPDPALLQLLLRHSYVPVVASLGVEGTAILNVNADVMACRVAAALGSADLVIAGTTAGVLDHAGVLVRTLDLDGIGRFIADGTATAGMIAKLASCRAVLAAGVSSIRIIDGRSLDGARLIEHMDGTRLVGKHAGVPA